MTPISTRLARLLLTTALILAGTAQAQVNPAIADCVELKDEASAAQAQMCATHAGCKLVLSIQKSCAKAKTFLNNLGGIVSRDRDEAKAKGGIQESQSPISGLLDGLKSALGIKQQVTSNQVYEAALSDDARAAMANNPAWQKRAAYIREAVSKADNEVLTGAGKQSTTWVYLGDVKDGDPHGWGTRFFSSGEIQRGKFSYGSLWGVVEVLFADGDHRIGTWTNSRLQGEGLVLTSAGRRYEGGFQEDGASGQGALYRKDGTLEERGIYENGQLSVGERFDEQGNVIARIDKPREAQEKAQHEAAEKAREKARLAAEAENQRKRLAARKQEVAQANQERRPVASPNLNALIEQIKGTKP